MLSRAPRRRARRRALTCAALAALALSALLAPAAPAAVRSNALISVTGTHNFSTFGVYDVSGSASITSTQLPAQSAVCRFSPVDPCRTLSITSILRATPQGGGHTCSFTGTTTQTLAVADTYSVDAIVLPPNPILPPNPVFPTDPCAPLGTFAVRYNLAISADNTITSVVAQTEPVT